MHGGDGRFCDHVIGIPTFSGISASAGDHVYTGTSTLAGVKLCRSTKLLSILWGG